MVKLIDLSGQTFGRLTVARYLGKRRWECVCECGTIKSIMGDNLKSNDIQSCGCLRLERVRAFNTTHGQSKTPTYKSWAGAKDRCSNPNTPCYPHYGGRGIKMCDRWAASFEAFLEDMGPRPSTKHSLDRKDNDGDYELGNCRWATAMEQGNNRRTNHPIAAFGESKTVAEWAQDPRCAVNKYTLRQRIVAYGWGAEQAIVTPPAERKRE
jgi:hypothetical protein